MGDWKDWATKAGVAVVVLAMYVSTICYWFSKGYAKGHDAGLRAGLQMSQGAEQ